MASTKRRPEAKRLAKSAKKPKRASAKPANMPRLSPYLGVRDVKKALAYYEKAFGFETRLAMPGPDGKPVHAEMEYLDTVVMLGPEMDGFPSPSTLGGTPVGLYMYVPDVDRHYAWARTVKGGKILRELADQFYGDRNYTIQDPDGHRWSFGTHVRDVSFEECQPGS